MLRKRELGEQSPLFLAVRAVRMAANYSDRTPGAGERSDVWREAGLLCRRAAAELESRVE